MPAAVAVGLFVTLPAVHLEYAGDVTLSGVIPRLNQRLAVELNPVANSFAIRDEERRGQMQPFAPRPAIAFKSDRTRAINRGMGLLQRFGEEGVVVQAPEFPLVRKGTVGGPGLEDDLGAFVVAFVVLVLVDPKDLVRVLQKSPPDAVLQTPAREHVEHGVFLGQANRMIQRNQ